MNMQAFYDLEIARNQLEGRIEHEVTPHVAEDSLVS
jgi:hypothetical protein